MMKLSLAFSFLLAVSVSAQNIVEVAVTLPDVLSTLVDLVMAAELEEALATTQDITVFAPTNDAFGDLDSTIVDNLMTEEWKLHLQDTLLYHVVPSVVPAGAVTDGLVATTLSGENITLSVPAEGEVVVNDSSNVVQANVDADNGIVHVVDEVLLPSWVSNSIVDRAVESPNLGTLVQLVTQAQLVDTLSGPGPFTVFAPTDDAFMEALAALSGRQADEELLETELVSTLLTYHVVEGIFPASSISDGLELTTVQGESLTFSVTEDGATVDETPIIATDVLANNGIVHVISGVLVPEAAADNMIDPVPSPTEAMPEPSSMTPAPAPTAAASSKSVFVGIFAAILSLGAATSLAL